LIWDFTAVFDREIQVEQDQIWTGRIPELALLAEARQGFFAVTGDHQIVSNFTVRKDFLREADVGLVVLNQ
jgi:hypothetical protein